MTGDIVTVLQNRSTIAYKAFLRNWYCI